MALLKAAEVAWVNIFDAPFVYFAGCDVSGGYQVAKPLGGEWVNLVVVSRHIPSGRNSPGLRGCGLGGLDVVVGFDYLVVLGFGQVGGVGEGGSHFFAACVLADEAGFFKALVEQL